MATRACGRWWFSSAASLVSFFTALLHEGYGPTLYLPYGFTSLTIEARPSSASLACVPHDGVQDPIDPFSWVTEGKRRGTGYHLSFGDRRRHGLGSDVSDGAERSAASDTVQSCICCKRYSRRSAAWHNMPFGLFLFIEGRIR